jgi:cysteine-rich repeat protein
VIWTADSQSPITGTGTSSNPWVVTTNVRNAAGFRAALTIRYALGDAHFDLEVVVTPPPTNAANVKLFHVVDTYLAGGDNGAAFVQPPTGIPSVIGVTRSGQYEVFVAGNRLWDRYFSGNYSIPYTDLASGGDLSNALDFNVSTDNGAAVQWNLGAITTAQTIRYRMSFSAVTTVPVCGDGAVAGFESCDDGNVAGGDGCSALCQIEDGYGCTGAPSVCGAVCGNGVRTWVGASRPAATAFARAPRPATTGTSAPATDAPRPAPSRAAGRARASRASPRAATAFVPVPKPATTAT